MSVRVVGFDGTPVPCGSGVRTAILDTGESGFFTSGRRRVSHSEFERLAERGYVTRVALDVAGTDRVVVYRTPTPRHDDVTLEGVRWSPCGEFEVVALTRDEAEQVLTSLAKSRRVRAMLAWDAGRRGEAVRLAREGLMAIPGLRSSAVAAELYSVLYADAFGVDDRLTLTRREMTLMLDSRMCDHAITKGNELRVDCSRPPGRRLVERSNSYGVSLR